MTILNKEENFFDDENFLQLHKVFFLWPGSFELCVMMLEVLPFCDSIEQLLKTVFLRNINIFRNDENSIRFLVQFKKYKYSDLATSVIFHYLKSKYKERSFLDYIDWEKVLSGLLNPAVTDSVFFFFEKFNILQFLLETKTEKNFISGVIFYYKPTFTIIDKNSKEITNLLKFLKVDQSSINSLVTKSYNDQNLDHLKKFLMKYQLKSFKI